MAFTINQKGSIIHHYENNERCNRRTTDIETTPVNREMPPVIHGYKTLKEVK